MGPTEIIVAVKHGHLLQQPVLALAQRADPPSHRRHMLADGQVEALHECRLDLPAAGRQHLLDRLQRAKRSCPSSLRLNTRGLPDDHHKGKKAYPRGPSGPPSGPLTPGDVLDVSHADARHRLRSPPLAASYHSCGLTPPLAAARVVHETP